MTALSWGAGQATQVRMTGASSTDWVKSDPSRWRTEEDFVSTASDNDQIALAQVQNRVLFDIEASSPEVTPPFILASPSFGPMKIVPCSLDLEIQYLDELPDMALFLTHELSDNGYQLERKYRIPLNTWFPASAIDDPSDSPAFYQISYSNEGVVEGRIAIPSSLVARGKDLRLIRVAEYRGKKKSVRLGVARLDG